LTDKRTNIQGENLTCCTQNEVALGWWSHLAQTLPIFAGCFEAVALSVKTQHGYCFLSHKKWLRRLLQISILLESETASSRKLDKILLI
jgi:hypothetical protein